MASSLLNGLPVLVVDDDPLSGKLFKVALELEGCEVRTGVSAEEALLQLEDFRAKLVLIDLVLPLTSGLLLASTLRHHPSTSGALLVAVTALHGPQIETMARNAGFAACLFKPVDPLSLPQILLDQLQGAP